MNKYKCFAFLDRGMNEKMHSRGYNAGYANGYVAIPPEHPLYGVYYKNVQFPSIHKGITFSCNTTIIKQYWDKKDQEWLDHELPDNYWVFGFYTLHTTDDIYNTNRECVVKEIQKLKQYLENYENNKI